MFGLAPRRLKIPIRNVLFSTPKFTAQALLASFPSMLSAVTLGFGKGISQSRYQLGTYCTLGWPYALGGIRPFSRVRNVRRANLRTRSIVKLGT
jgi:hypothetical protein